MNNLVNLVKEKIVDSIKCSGYELYHIEYVNELGHNYLRVMITNKDSNKKITIKDCEIVSKSINFLIDELSVHNKFFLEVSSPGINRKLYTTDHILDSVGKYVLVKLNKPIDNIKKFNGYIKGANDNEVIFTVKNEEMKVNTDIIKSINLEEISREDIHE